MASSDMGNVSDTISDIMGYSLYAEAVPGSNGDPNGSPTYDMGTDPSTASYGYNTWDANASYDTGFDTGSTGFDLDANLGSANLGSGSDTLSVDSAGEISYTGSGSQSIGSVKIRAGAQVPGVVSWTNLTIEFYQGSTMADSLTVSQGPAVDTTPSSSSGTAEQILTVTPASSSTAYTRVTVVGTIRMQTPAGSMPGPDDLFCQVFVMP
jgi:hypothetical protein